MMTLGLAAVYLLPFGPGADPGYPNPNLLVEAEELANAPGRYHVLDVRSKENYADGHIPGSVNAATGAWSKAVTEGTATPALWAKEFAAVGVTPDKPVVVVSDDIRSAARARWLMALAGVPDVRLLNGGWNAYIAAKLPTSEEPTTVSAPPHDWKAAPERQATMADVKGVIEKKRPGQIIDVRSDEEYAAGHIPGAKRLEWSEVLDERTKKFKPAAELAKLFQARNIDPAEESCSH